MSIRVSSLLILLAAGLSTPALALKKGDKKVVKQLKADITYLASDELSGRRTGTDGERKAADYIEKRYTQMGIAGYKGQYRFPFKFVYGKEPAPSTLVRINNKPLKLYDDIFPLPFSASKRVTGEVLPDVTEQGNIWLMPLYSDADQANDAHTDADKRMYDMAKDAAKGGASGVVFYDNYGSKYEPTYSKHSEYDALDLPVVFMKNSAYQQFVQHNGNNQKSGLAMELNIAISKTERTGNNLATYIDNGAPYTVIIGAHYDHLGYGEDGNSLHANASKDHLIHHGADDNASGTAALMEIAKWTKSKKLHHFNYLFVHFSGEELGLFGSKAFVKDQGIDSSKIAYMINLDMVGRLNDSTHALTVGGVGTSPAWADVVAMGRQQFKLVIDSSGIGPSDHTSFYYAGIPVLFFFTGTHKDYHKPTDVAELINYDGEVSVIKYAEEIMAKMDKDGSKPKYTTTKQNTVGKVRFKVTLGIMPDYSYQDGGVRVDGVSEGRPAANAGIKAGDVLLQLGDHKIQSMQSYMEALGKFTPGDTTQIRLKRGDKEMSLPILLNK